MRIPFASVKVEEIAKSRNYTQTSIKEKVSELCVDLKFKKAKVKCLLGPGKNFIANLDYKQKKFKVYGRSQYSTDKGNLRVL